MVDAGISNKKIETRLNKLGLSGKDISGIFLTHEHSDHIAGLEVFVRKNEIPVYASSGTLRYLSNKDKYSKITDYFHIIESSKHIRLGDLEVLAFDIDHDANEPFGYRVECGDKKIAILSEKGHLSNESSGKLICEILNNNIKKIFLGHLSDKNNLPELALESVRFEIFADERPYNPMDFDIEVAKRDELSEICYV